MQNEKMTDEQIIKALECCSKKDCKQCPAFDENIECGENLITLALDLINRKNAEVERYKGVIKILESDVKHEREAAVKGFAHLLIDKAEAGVIHVGDLPDYVVEFLEEDKDERQID